MGKQTLLFADDGIEVLAEFIVPLWMEMNKHGAVLVSDRRAKVLWLT